MKRTLAALTASVVGAAIGIGPLQAIEIYKEKNNSIDLYGQVGVGFYFTRNPDERGDQSHMRLGLKGKTELGSDLFAIGQFEYQRCPSNQTEELRLAFVGVEHSTIGKLTYGRQWGVSKLTHDYTHVAPEFAGEASFIGKDTFGLGRCNNLLQYRNKLPFGLELGLQYLAPYKRTKPSEKDFGKKDPIINHSDGGAIAVAYTSPFGIGVSATYSQATNLMLPEHKQARFWMGAVKYELKQLYLAASYSQASNTLKPFDGDHKSTFASRTKGLELVAQYKCPHGITPCIGYMDRKAYVDPKDTLNLTTVKTLQLGAEYEVTKNFIAGVDLKWNLLNKNKLEKEKVPLNSEHILSCSVLYKFC